MYSYKKKPKKTLTYRYYVIINLFWLFVNQIVLTDGEQF